jgi:hypothetical protein
MEQQKSERNGLVDKDSLKAIGKALNAEYVVSAKAMRVGSKHFFSAQILRMDNGSLKSGYDADYTSIDDGFNIMRKLAANITGAAADLAARKVANTKFNSIGVYGGTSLAEPWAIAGIIGTWGFYKYMFLDVGIDAGFISRYEYEGKRTDVHYWSVYPYAHFNGYLPLGGRKKPRIGGLFAGAGFGVMISSYKTAEQDLLPIQPAFDGTAGVLLGGKYGYFRLTYSIRVGLTKNVLLNRIVAGYSWRFK